MNPIKQSAVSLLGGLGLAMAALSFATTAQANVYATNIKFNGALSNATVGQGSGLTLSYILNEPATLGTTLKILSGTNVVRTYSYASGSSGALMGLNVVTWDGKNTGGSNVAVGAYSVSITAAAVGFTNWTQTSIDTNSGIPAYYPLGIAVDNNINSPYYGRVVMSCALHNGSNPNTPFAAQKDGLYKMNADGTKADEGWYGNAGYLADDGGDGATAGEMPNSGGYNPMKVRIGEDDRIYWVDNSNVGAILACDMQATTNQVVIKEAGYANNPDYSDFHAGCQEFDVCATTTTNAAIYMCDNDFPNWGVWMFHMTNGVADPADTVGTQAVIAGGFSDLSLVSSGGVMVDYNLDIFVGQDRNGENPVYDAMLYTNWNGGVLPPEGSSSTFAYGNNSGQVAWGYGSDVNTTSSSDPTFEGVRDMVINSRINPTILACPMSGGTDNGAGGGIRLLNATNGTVITAGSQVLTNLDWNQAYTCAAWDNVGNLYGASTTRNLWRVYSPPGANTNTTVAVPTVNVVAAAVPPAITQIAVSGTTVTIKFTAPAGTTVSMLTLYSSATVAPASSYAPVSGAVITLVSPGVFQATATTSGSSTFYRIALHP